MGKEEQGVGRSHLRYANIDQQVISATSVLTPGLIDRSSCTVRCLRPRRVFDQDQLISAILLSLIPPDSATSHSLIVLADKSEKQGNSRTDQFGR